MHIGRSVLAGLAALLTLTTPALSDEPKPAAKSLAEATSGLRRLPGLLPVYLDAKGGRVLLALKPDEHGDCGEYLYQVYMRAGLGSTPVGIDRNNPGPTHILAFHRAGPKVLAELENEGFRAGDGVSDEQQAVRESFPPSIVWSGGIAGEDADGAILVDISGFLTRDAFGVVDALRAGGQGGFRLAADRSYPDVAGVQAFPENLEFEAHQTFESDKPGAEVKGVVPEPHAVTLVEHQSLIKLPPPGFTPRRADPRTGTFSELVADYGAGLDQPVVYRLATRFRLEKTDPGGGALDGEEADRLLCRPLCA